VAAMLPATTKGVLEMKLVGLGVQSTSRLLLTNMSLVAKKTSVPGKPWDQSVRVWALDMDSGALIDSVDVSLVRMSGKVVGRCATANGAGCTLSSHSDTDPDQAEPFSIIARKGDDLTYIRYADLRATVEGNTAGQPYVSDTPYRASVFADRGVYRPGETTHIVAIVRDAKDKAPDQPLPVDVKLVDPRTKVARKLTLKTNAGGMISFDHALPAFADTGHWRVQLSVADKPLASYDLQVEEFVPERMAVTVAAKQEQVLAGGKVQIDVGARYLFGGNAMDSGVEVVCSVEPMQFVPDMNDDLTYGVEPRGKAVPLGEARGQLDMAGKATIACPDATTPFTRTADLTATVSVLEAGSGRATVRTASATIHPEKFYIGLKSKASRAVPGDTFTVEGMIVDWTGKPVTTAVKKLDVELVHLEADYGYGYNADSGEERYDRSMREVPEGKREVVVTNGKFSFDVTPGESQAGFTVRAKAGKAKTELLLEGEYPYEYDEWDEGGGRTVDQTPRPARPTQLAIDLPKEIEVGKPITVKVKTPYKGKLLWTVETNQLVKAEWKDATGAESTWTFSVAAFAPNIYVSAFLVKDPHLESKDAFMPDRALGVASARVIPTQFTQPVTLTVPKEIRSSSPLTVTLDLGAAAAKDGPTFATIAVVDEGILSLTGFQTPNPLAQLFAKRALGVETYETIGWTMLHQAAGASSRTGGGDDYGEEGENGGELDNSRVQPVKPVALFSGVVPVAANGKVTIPFEIPTYRGQLRIMAITSSATRVGRAEAKVTVRDPLVVQVTFPRFVSHNDEMQIPVFLTNVSGGPLDVSLTLTSEHLPVAGLVQPKGTPVTPIMFTGKSTGSVKLMDGRAETLVFAAKAMIPVGGAKLRVIATAKGAAIGTLEVRDEVEVPFLPAGPKERTVQKLKVDAGTLNLSTLAALKGWAPTSEHTTFWLTTNPYGEAFQHLQYLVHYPYGCIEQTTSTVRPLLYVGALAEQVDPKLAALKIEDMILAGINRVLSMETPSGGFGYWPGSTEPLEWATAYATHMLLDAKKAGYAVPDDRLKEILGWIEQRVTQHERGDRIQRDKWNYYDEQSEAYLHYVLAVAGKGRKARISKLIAKIPATAKGEQLEDLYMLKAALYLAGDRRHEKELKAVDVSPISAERINSWSFYSDRRRRGLMLSTFFDLFGNDPAGELLATRVAEGLADNRSGYYNTQELVWGVTGLGKWVKASAAKGTAAGTLRADGAVIDPRKSKQASSDKTWSLLRASEYKALTLEVPASAQGLWLVINSEGVRTGSDYKVGGNGMTISRTYRSMDGEIIDPAATDAIKLGDVLFVEVQLENTSGVTIQNIALVDRLPAGFEIENPRLGRTQKIDWLDPVHIWALDFMNMRDDRLQAFGALGPKTSKKIVYTVRAVTSGKFTIPPVEAEAMYDPTLWARAKGGTALVGGPWTGKTL
ncbi:MAG: MG2 domain-containing protein, partial [Myxococcota bacterium]|nr:MG2 domain-containing protein [Myxococcota bacterium]